MKKLSIICILGILIFPISIFSEDFLHIDLYSPQPLLEVREMEKSEDKPEGAATPELEAASPQKTPILWLAPSVNIDVFVMELATRRQTLGIVPGVGYGIRWNPEWFQEFGSRIGSISFLALDLYVSGDLSEENSTNSSYDYFNISLLPSLTIMDWFSVGFGFRYKIAWQGSGLTDVSSALFSFGLRKSIN